MQETEFEAPWSPSGSQIVFQKFNPKTHFIDRYIMNGDGTGLRQLTDHPAYDGNATWQR